MKLRQIKSWGIDIGNVIFRNLPESIQRAHEQDDSSPEEIIQQLHLIPDAIAGVRLLVQKVGAEHIWFVSKAGTKQIATTRLAFEKFKIYQQTGIKKDQILFVSSRRDKIPVIKSLGLEGYIDDRGEIIFSIQNFVKYPLWFCPDIKDADKWAHKMKYSVRVISGWRQFMEMY